MSMRPCSWLPVPATTEPRRSDGLTSDPVARLNTVPEGRYPIERQIGEGGMAVVYLAEDVINLGPLINSDQDDRCPGCSLDYSVFCFDSEREGGHGNKLSPRHEFALRVLNL